MTATGVGSTAWLGSVYFSGFQRDSCASRPFFFFGLMEYFFGLMALDIFGFGASQIFGVLTASDFPDFPILGLMGFEFA